MSRIITVVMAAMLASFILFAILVNEATEGQLCEIVCNVEENPEDP